MNTLHFVIVGHVDHGKSTLIGRLLYDTNSLPPDRVEEIKAAARDMGRDAEFAHLLDHLEEERLQGITIETTQVFFKWEGREYVIIDAPGHVEFVKNMITGASHASAAVLIIDAHEGIREQTKRHAYILALLGIRSVIVLINKMDLVAYDEQVYRTIARESAVFLAQVGIMSAPCIPVAALQGENIVTRSAHCVWYNGPTFIEALARMTADRDADILPLRLPVQDVYKVDEKRINVGRIEAGCLHAGDRITIMPHNQTTVIKTIERYPEQVASAGAGECVGVTTDDSVFCDRGDVICQPGSEPTYTQDVRATVIWLSKHTAARGERMIFKCATQEIPCKIETITRRINSSTLAVLEEQASHLEYLDVGEVVLHTKKPVAVEAFTTVQELGRFVLVKDENTCAGGIVTAI